jgi:hypothetical protein
MEQMSLKPLFANKPKKEKKEVLKLKKKRKKGKKLQDTNRRRQLFFVQAGIGKYREKSFYNTSSMFLQYFICTLQNKF